MSRKRARPYTVCPNHGSVDNRGCAKCDRLHFRFWPPARTNYLAAIARAIIEELGQAAGPTK